LFWHSDCTARVTESIVVSRCAPPGRAVVIVESKWRRGEQQRRAARITQLNKREKLGEELVLPRGDSTVRGVDTARRPA
jgi:hypothetical protein